MKNTENVWVPDKHIDMPLASKTIVRVIYSLVTLGHFWTQCAYSFHKCMHYIWLHTHVSNTQSEQQL